MGSPQNRILVRLEQGGSTTATLQPGTIETVVLRVTSQDAALHFTISFDYDETHFEAIAPQEVFLTKGVAQDIQFDLVTKAVPEGTTGLIDMNIDAPGTVTTQPLSYTFEP